MKKGKDEMRRGQKARRAYEHDTTFSVLREDDADEVNDAETEAPPGTIQYKKEKFDVHTAKKGRKKDAKRSEGRRESSHRCDIQFPPGIDKKSVDKNHQRETPGCNCSTTHNPWMSRKKEQNDHGIHCGNASHPGNRRTALGCCLRGPAKEEDGGKEREKQLSTQINELNNGKNNSERWELFTITVDSGAAESVTPPGAGSTFPIVETQAARDGLYYITASVLRYEEHS